MAYAKYDTEDHFCDNEGTIGGEAQVYIESVNTLDGPCFYATLISVKIGGLVLTADQMAEAFGAKAVVAYEDILVEDLTDAVA